MNDVDRWIYFDGPEPERVRPLLDALREVAAPRPTPEDKARRLAAILEKLDASLVSPPGSEGPTISGITGTQGPTRWCGSGSSRSLPWPEGARGQGARRRRRSGVAGSLR
jgi:hypothetical protein